jgi:hypothetical protein
MNEGQTPAKTPTHLWIVGVVSALWNAFGGYDYVMTQTKNMDYLKMFTPEQIDYFMGFPAWLDAAWALGVWGAVAGSVLLLARSRFAVHAFGVSLLGMVVSFIYQFGMTNVMKLFGPGPAIFSFVILLVGIALLIYARRQVRAAVLK